MAAYQPEADIKVESVQAFPVDNSASILVSLTAQSSAVFLGHYGLKVRYRKAAQVLERKMVLKVKPPGKEISKMLLGLASHCGEPLASTYEKHWRETGFDNTHGRETVIYQSFDSPLFPQIFGLLRDDAEERYFILMEYLEDVELLNSVMAPEKWDDARIKLALAALAQWHADHLDQAPPEPRYWSDTASPHYMTDKQALWQALLENAHQHCPEVYTDALYQQLNEILAAYPRLQAERAALPSTLVHNDANPRNACIKDGAFCLYDWELCNRHLPQYDVVEWLCFVLDQERYSLREDYLEYYRQKLNDLSGGRFRDAEAFKRGFHLAAVDFALHRLGMYMMAHAVSPYPFLPRVVKSLANTLSDFRI